MSKKSERPAFSAPFYAALRQGSKELGQALKAFPDSMQPVEEPGTLGNPTQAQLTNGMKEEEKASFKERFQAFANRLSGCNSVERENDMER